MVRRGTGAVAVLYQFIILLVAVCAGDAVAQVDSLTLQSPTNVYVIPEMAGDRQSFVNYIFWTAVDPVIGTYIHRPDTNGWNPSTSNTPNSALSVPSSGGTYLGTIDRTIGFRALNTGIVGTTPSVKVRFEIIAEEEWNATLDAGSAYTVGSPMPCVFRNTNTGAMMDIGLRVQFSPGQIDSNGVFFVGMEDFEGYHMWRGIETDGSDLTVLGELSKQEEFAGGSVIDSLYFNAIIPALRTTGVYRLPGPVPGLGDAIDIRNIHPNGTLGASELMWFDANAFNGFTYQYLVTTFDRDYNVKSHSQGLIKFDNCAVTQGTPISCQNDLFTLSNEVTPQNTMREIYAVPNPYRTGSTQYTAPNYHNYPDNKIRFVNVPTSCELRIYTPAGDLVRSLHNETGTGVIEWDVRNRGGEEVSSGVYIFRVERNNGDSMYGRLTIIR